MEKERCHGCNKWFVRMEQHLTYHNHCQTIMTEHARKQRVDVDCRSDKNGLDPLDLIGTTIHLGSSAENDDGASIAVSTRGAKRQRRIGRDADEHSNITMGDFSPTISSPIGGVNGMEADWDSTGSILAVHDVPPPPTSESLQPSVELPQPPSTNTLALGTALSFPVDEILAGMAPNTQAEDALLDLYIMLSKAGSPLYLFDKVVAYLEKHAGRTFKMGATLPRRETLLKTMRQKHKIPPPEPVPVVLENGAEGTPEYHRGREDLVTVQSWPFEEMMKQYLVDPFLFGNKDNLVNTNDPWGKYVSSDPDNDKEVLASYWYSKTYDQCITDPNTQFLLCLEAYVDKTAKSAGITSYAGEPFLLSAVHLKKSVREDSSAWFVQAYLPDLEVGSSAKKRQQSNRGLRKGMSNRNYHKVMDAVLQGIRTVQKKGGFKAFVRMGDVVRLMMVMPVIAFVKGDAKSGDTLVSRFGGKNCIARVPRMCLCAKSDLDDPLHRCLWIRMDYQQELNDNAVKLLTPPENTAELTETTRQKRAREKEMKQYIGALHDMSAHRCTNSFFEINFGYNPFGITLATPSDMMHLYESGIVRRVCQAFVDSMSTNVRVQVDHLMEVLFRSQRTTLSNSQNFLRTNFRGGATRLTMLSSHHWPGMMFSFLLLLLTPKGKEICSSCFQDSDVEEPDYDWDSAPGFDLDHVYKPPILFHGRNNDGDDDEVEQEEETPAEDDLSSVSEDTDVLRTRKGPVTMNCSLRQFVHLLESLLVFHAMYKCGPPLFGPDSDASDAEPLLLSIRKLVAQIITYCPRHEGNKWKLQKLHEILHFPLMMFFFRHAENFDAGTGERHLKDVFKDVARNSQQRGQETFLSQVGARMHEKLIMTKAKQFSAAMAEYYSEKQRPKEGTGDVTHTLPQKKMYVITYHVTTHEDGRDGGGCTARLTGMNPSTQIHPVILSWLANNWENEIGIGRESIDCYTEMKVKGGPTYRAHPNYCNNGPWQDWANVTFGNDQHGTVRIVPSRVLLFYIHYYSDDDGCQNSEIKALVQTCQYRVGNVETRWQRMDETHLCSQWELSMRRGSSQDEVRVNVPELYSVPAQNLDSPVLVFEENPGLCESWKGKRYIWSVKDRRTEWAHMFPLPDN